MTCNDACLDGCAVVPENASASGSYGETGILPGHCPGDWLGADKLGYAVFDGDMETIWDGCCNVPVNQQYLQY